MFYFSCQFFGDYCAEFPSSDFGWVNRLNRRDAFIMKRPAAGGESCKAGFFIPDKPVRQNRFLHQASYLIIHSISLSFISRLIKQKRIYLLSRNGKVEQSRTIIFSRIARSNSKSEVIPSANSRTSIKLPLGGYGLNLLSSEKI